MELKNQFPEVANENVEVLNTASDINQVPEKIQQVIEVAQNIDPALDQIDEIEFKSKTKKVLSNFDYSKKQSGALTKEIQKERKRVLDEGKGKSGKNPQKAAKVSSDKIITGKNNPKPKGERGAFKKSVSKAVEAVETIGSKVKQSSGYKKIASVIKNLDEFANSKAGKLVGKIINLASLVIDIGKAAMSLLREKINPLEVAGRFAKVLIGPISKAFGPVGAIIGTGVDIVLDYVLDYFFPLQTN